MSIRSHRLTRIILLTLTLGIVLAGLALAESAPVCADRQAGKACASRMSVAGSQPALAPALTISEPSPSACFWAWYEEYWKDGDICRWYNSCTGERWGSCPNGYDYRTNEVFPCC
jgi:hypothetical protein